MSDGVTSVQMQLTGQPRVITKVFDTELVSMYNTFVQRY